MKLFFSLLILLIHQPSSGKDIFVINYQNNEEKAQMTKSVLNKYFAIPKEYISIEKTENTCPKKQDFMYQVCITKENKILVRDNTGNQFEAIKGMFQENILKPKGKL